MAQRAVTSADFKEGVRAILIDKDNAPKWEPPSLGQVKTETLAEYFKPLEYELLLPV